jgi:hypothetical protein
MKNSPLTGKKALAILTQGIALPNGKIIKLVDPGALSVDHSYQRGLVPSSVDRIRREFDADALGMFEVGQRKNTGSLNVVDGQNRLEAIRVRKALNEKVPDHVLCIIKPETSLAQEAKMFVLLNTNKPVTGNARFKARLVQPGAQPERTIETMAKKEGFSLDFLSAGRPTDTNKSTAGVKAVGALLKAYNTCHGQLANAFKLLRLVEGKGKAQNVPYNLRNGEVIYALAMFLRNKFPQQQDIGIIASYWRSRHWSMEMAWDNIRKTTGNGYRRPEELVKRLDDAAAGLFRKAAKSKGKLKLAA